MSSKAPNKISILPICAYDLDTLVENFCFPWDTPKKTREKWDTYFGEHKKNIRTVAVVKDET